MEDSEIVALYWARSENAIAETEKKYDRYCFSIASNILPIREDARECVNDTYFAAWRSMPPHRPAVLSAFLGKLTRRISIDRWRSCSAEKRGGGNLELAFEELSGCIPSGSDPQAQLEAKELAASINRFLAGLPLLERSVFLRRYFRLEGLQTIAAEYAISLSKTKSMLHRTRRKLRAQLQKEGY